MVPPSTIPYLLEWGWLAEQRNGLGGVLSAGLAEKAVRGIPARLSSLEERALFRMRGSSCGQDPAGKEVACN
jgi:hypothetical protein